MHRHVWKITDEKRIPSVMEQLASAAPGGFIKYGATGPRSMADDSYIVRYRCAICGTEKVERV